MKITILGAGAMGSLIGSLLSSENELTLIDLNKDLVSAIKYNGVSIKEKDGTVKTYYPNALTESSNLGIQDLVIVFVKSMFSESALDANRKLIGPSTFLMTLQNGAGHEHTLLKFAEADKVIIGSTQHNSSIISLGIINHGGTGPTSIGLINGDNSSIVDIAKTFSNCKIECSICDNVQKQIWHKLFTNTAASSLTAIFQQPLGFICNNPFAHSLMRHLVHEAVETADSLNLGFVESEILAEVENVCRNAPNGFTSIYADIRDGRKTEVDTISGTVIRTAAQNGIQVPYHEAIVKIIHTLEELKV